MIFRFVAALLCFASASATHAEPPIPECQMIMTGALGNLGDAETGQAWLGFFREGGKYVLRETTIELSKVRGMDDPEEGPFTETYVGVKGEQSLPYFLLKGDCFDANSNVLSVFDASLQLIAGTEIHLSVGKGSLLLLKASGDPCPEVFDKIKNYKLALIGGPNLDKVQVVAQADQTFSGLPRLLWAGDLENDGKLDFLLDTTTRSQCGEGRVELLLSSAAKDGEWAHSVATLGRSCGC